MATCLGFCIVMAFGSTPMHATARTRFFHHPESGLFAAHRETLPSLFGLILRETASGWLRIGIHIESRYFASRGRSARTIRAMIQSDGVEPTNRRRCRSGWSPPYPPAEGCGDFYPASSVNFYGCDTRWLDGLLHKPLTVRGGNVWQPKLKFRRVLGW